jgi:hypothetical protein
LFSYVFETGLAATVVCRLHFVFISGGNGNPSSSSGFAMTKVNSLGYNWNKAERIEAIYSHHYGLFVIGDQRLRLELFAPGSKMLIEFAAGEASRRAYPSNSFNLPVLLY